MDLHTYQKYMKAARGIISADLVLKNANIINVFTREIITGDVGIVDGMIIGIGSYKGEAEIDLTGKYICPGFIDSHLHFESTMVTPAELVVQAARCGTTTFIADPHESANVSGVTGIDYILEQTCDVPANVFVMMPSCVPATTDDDNGAVIECGDMKPYLKNGRILGLGEVMDYRAVVEGRPAMFDKLSLFSDRICDGHAPFLNEKELQAYALARIATDHECSTYEYAMQERRCGMHVLIREGSGARNLDAIVRGIVADGGNTEGFCFCTDDKHIEDIIGEGHINYNVKRAVELGIDIIKAICMATIQPAKCYGLKDLGAVAAGYQADLVVFDNLQDLNVEAVFHRGVKLDQTEPKIKPCHPDLKQTVNIGSFLPKDLQLENRAVLSVIRLVPGELLTEAVPWSRDEGMFTADGRYQKIAVIERHKQTGKAGVGIVEGFSLCGGAIASSVSHDSHNIVVIGDNDEDMVLAVRELVRAQGGYTIVSNHRVYETLELPIMGLMSERGYEYVSQTLKRMLIKAHEMGVPQGIEPFINLSFLALPVIPEIRITSRGIYQVTESRFL